MLNLAGRYLVKLITKFKARQTYSQCTTNLSAISGIVLTGHLQSAKKLPGKVLPGSAARINSFLELL
jgi:hypothetical protein